MIAKMICNHADDDGGSSNYIYYYFIRHKASFGVIFSKEQGSGVFSVLSWQASRQGPIKWALTSNQIRFLKKFSTEVIEVRDNDVFEL